MNNANRKSFQIRTLLIALIGVLLIGSLIWTAVLLPLAKTPAKTNTAQLVYAPDYTIQAGKSLMIWKQGTQLEQGRTAYFYAAEPVMTVVPTLQLIGMQTGDWSGTIQTTTYLQAVDESHRIFWTYPLKVLPEESFLLPAQSEGAAKIVLRPISINLMQDYVTLQAINTELSLTSANFELVIQSDIKASGLIDGQSFTRSFQNNLPITLNAISFTLPKTADNLSQLDLSSETSASQGLLFGRTFAQDPLLILALLLDGLLGLVLLIELFIKRPKLAQKSVDHRKFREWISEGSVSLVNSSHVQINSLEGLVDLAIDLDKRVIYDPSRQKYFVPDENMLYAYDPNQMAAGQINRTQLGRLLLDGGVIHREQLETALFYHQRLNVPLGESLIALGFIDEKTLYKTLAEQSKLVFADLSASELIINQQAMQKLTLKQAQVLQLLPLQQQNDSRLTVVCSDPGRVKIIHALEEIFGQPIELAIVQPSVIRKALELLNSSDL